MLSALPPDELTDSFEAHFLLRFAQHREIRDFVKGDFTADMTDFFASSRAMRRPASGTLPSSLKDLAEPS